MREISQLQQIYDESYRELTGPARLRIFEFFARFHRLLYFITAVSTNMAVKMFLKEEN